MKTPTKLLDQTLDKNIVLRRADGMDYIAGYQVVAQANRIFGYDGWSYEITVAPHLEKEVDLNNNPYWYYTCQVKTTVHFDGKDVTREDIGIGEVTFTRITTDKQGKKVGGKPQLEVAIKGAVTDALKRAFRGYGNQFGNSLYDREDKLPGIQANLSTVDETALSQYVQKLLDCKTVEALEKELDALVQIAKQDDWNSAQLTYIKNLADRARKGIEARISRATNRKPKKEATKVAIAKVAIEGGQK